MCVLGTFFVLSQQPWTEGFCTHGRCHAWLLPEIFLPGAFLLDAHPCLPPRRTGRGRSAHPPAGRPIGTSPRSGPLGAGAARSAFSAPPPALSSPPVPAPSAPLPAPTQFPGRSTRALAQLSGERELGLAPRAPNPARPTPTGGGRPGGLAGRRSRARTRTRRRAEREPPRRGVSSIGGGVSGGGGVCVCVCSMVRLVEGRAEAWKGTEEKRKRVRGSIS